MEGHAFLKAETVAIFGLGFVAICTDTITGLLFGKLMCFLTGGKINPLIGAAGISAYPMAARVAQMQGQKYGQKKFSSYACNGSKHRRSDWVGHGRCDHAVRAERNGADLAAFSHSDADVLIRGPAPVDLQLCPSHPLFHHPRGSL